MIGRVIPKAIVRGVGVTLGTVDDLVSAIRGAIDARSPARTLCAVNVHTFMEAQRNPAYRAALNGADLAFLDGVPIRWLLRIYGHRPPPRVHGADLMLAILERSPGARHLFFGSTPETLELLLERLRRRLPELRVAGAISPPWRREASKEDPGILDRIHAAEPDVIWVALGAPKQELWAEINRGRLRVPVVACVGAAFEILAGRFTRAPGLMQRTGLEWAWRLAQDPARLWRRYVATNGAFGALLMRDLLSRIIRPQSSL